MKYFLGNISAGQSYLLSREDIISVSNLKIQELSNAKLEICLIGLLAYFEAFCKSQFSAIINICPGLIRKLAKSNFSNLIFNLSNFIDSNNDIVTNLGWIISENIDFGTAKKINNAFYSLLGFSPLTTSEIRRFEKLLNLRHLLVHGGGIANTIFNNENLPIISSDEKLHVTQVVFTKTSFEIWDGFLLSIVKKIMKFSQKELRAYIDKENIYLTPAQNMAVTALNVKKLSKGWL